MSNLITEAQRGDVEAWDALYRLVTPKLLVYYRARKPLDSSETEDDLVADTWVTIAQKIHEFSGNEKAFTAWAFTIATNMLLNSNRKTIRRKTYATDDFEWHNREEYDADWHAAEELLNRLKEPAKSIVLLMDLLGFSSAETGELLGLTATNVRVNRSRALKKLRKELSQS